MTPTQSVVQEGAAAPPYGYCYCGEMLTGERTGRLTELTERSRC